MGSKYLPSIKDAKASRRFQQKQQPSSSKFIKAPVKNAKKPKAG